MTAPFSHDREPMPISARQITHGNILRVLLLGFTMVILLLVAAGFVGVRNIHSIQASAATLVGEQDETSNLIEEIERERGALNAVLYHLARDPESVDRQKVLSDLKTVDENLKEVVDSAAGTPEEALALELRRAALDFSEEARRILAMEQIPSRLSRDLFHRHQQVASIVTKLIAASQAKSQSAQRMIDQRSKELVTESFVLLGASLALALLGTVLTVRMTTGLFRKMEWQASELSRVSWHMVENQEATARRFSHELHDELGQSLTALKTNLVSLGPERGANSRLEDSLHLVDGAIQNVRELSQLLRPTILDDFGLDASLRWLAERFSQRTGIATHYTSNFHARLADETETHLFRIAQETLTNVARHSGATTVDLDLHGDSSDILLSVSDNGRGFQNGGGAGMSGMGMIGMRARARSAGGELRLESSSGHGVSIQVRVPARIASDEQKDTHPAG